MLMILGLPWHFWLFMIAVVGGVAYLDIKIRHALSMPDIPQPFELTIKLSGGPFDGKEFTTSVLKQPSFFIQPYVPEDPPEEQRIAKVENYKNGEPVGAQEIYAPSFAYYQNVYENQYFYVRDVDEAEVEEVTKTGKLPEVRKS